SSDLPSNAIDDNVSTRFTTSASQTNGQVFQVNMGVPATFTQITLDAGSSSNDYPRGFQVYVSDDGANWRGPLLSGSPDPSFVTISFPYQTAQYIQVVQTGTASNWWSIAEFNVFGIPPAMVPRDAWLASASLNNTIAGSATDGRLGTRWYTGTAQTPGQSFQL